jgi:hypothetical protein
MNGDRLEGIALAEAVAMCRGWKRVLDALIGECWELPDESRVVIQEWYHPDNYRPDRDIAQAFELDGKGWYWESIEFHSGYSNGPTTGLVVYVRDRNVRQIAGAGVELADFPTKAQAYATARCRAYLKATDDA